MVTIDITQQEVWDHVSAQLGNGKNAEEICLELSSARSIPPFIVLNHYYRAVAVNNKKGIYGKSWSELALILKSRALEFFYLHGPQSGLRKSGGPSMKQILDEFAKESGKSYYSVKNYYYSYLHPQVMHELYPRDYQNTADSSKIKEAMDGSPKVGDVVMCTVEQFAPFGVFVLTDGGYLALLHLSNIRNEFTDPDQLGDFFYIGEKFQAKVVRVDPKTGQIGVSTRMLGGKKRLSDHTKQQIQTTAMESLEKAYALRLEQKNPRNTAPEMESQGGAVIKKEPAPLPEHELNELTAVIGRCIGGSISDASRKKLVEMVEKFGLVKTAVAINSTGYGYDPGIIFLDTVRRELEQVSQYLI